MSTVRWCWNGTPGRSGHRRAPGARASEKDVCPLSVGVPRGSRTSLLRALVPCGNGRDPALSSTPAWVMRIALRWTVQEGLG